MRKRSLSHRYFGVFSVTAFVSVLVFGFLLIVFISRYMIDEKYIQMEDNAYEAASVTSYIFGAHHSFDETALTQIYAISAAALDADVFLVDFSGETILAAGTHLKNIHTHSFPNDIILQTLDSGYYKGEGRLNGLLDIKHYIVGIPVMNQETPIALLYICSAPEILAFFRAEVVKIFLICAFAVLCIAFFFIYLFTRKMVQPLNEMLQATQDFTHGDFTKRVPVRSADEIGQLAEAFNNMASELAITERARRSFVANVSHELKTPMTTIGGFVDGILDGTIPKEKRFHYLKVVSNEVKRLSRLVRSMLDTSRIEAGELEMHAIDFDISEVIRKILFTFERPIEEKQLEIRGLDAEKIIIHADIDLMHQVVYNLIDNAVKFVNDEGYIEFRFRTGAEKVCIAIRNSGEGIQKDEATRLFDRFYKSDKSRSLNTQGAGLGLHIAKSIVQFHHGEIAVHSEEDSYTEFEFCLPNTAVLNQITDFHLL